MIPLETTAYRAALGLQFINSVGGASVADGLVVTAWPADAPWDARTAAQSPISTIMGFGRLPGLASYESATTQDPETFTWSPPETGRPFEVRVTDPFGRYLPELISVTVPRSTLATPLLFSAPARPLPRASPPSAARCRPTHPAGRLVDGPDQVRLRHLPDAG